MMDRPDLAHKNLPELYSTIKMLDETAVNCIKGEVPSVMTGWSTAVSEKDKLPLIVRRFPAGLLASLHLKAEVNGEEL